MYAVLKKPPINTTLKAVKINSTKARKTGLAPMRTLVLYTPLSDNHSILTQVNTAKRQKAVNSTVTAAAYLAFTTWDFFTGKSTVYRLISKLCEDGDVLRTRGENGKKILYRYIDKAHECDAHFHLKCRGCGKIIHLDCDFMEELKKHIAGEHGFRPDPRSTVINGVCAECEERERKE